MDMAYGSKPKAKPVKASRVPDWNQRTTNPKQPTMLEAITNHFLILLLPFLYKTLSPSSCQWRAPKHFWSAAANLNQFLLKLLTFLICLSLSLYHSKDECRQNISSWSFWLSIMNFKAAVFPAPVLLRYHWRTVLCNFSVHSIMIWLIYIVKWLPQ